MFVFIYLACRKLKRRLDHVPRVKETKKRRIHPTNECLAAFFLWQNNSCTELEINIISATEKKYQKKKQLGTTHSFTQHECSVYLHRHSISVELNQSPGKKALENKVILEHFRGWTLQLNQLKCTNKFSATYMCFFFISNELCGLSFLWRKMQLWLTFSLR